MKNIQNMVSIKELLLEAYGRKKNAEQDNIRRKLEIKCGKEIRMA